MSKDTATFENFLDKNLSIIKFHEESIGWDESNPNEQTVWVESKDESNLRHDWLNWIEYNDYSEYESFDEYIEAFLKSTGLAYGYLTPDFTFEL